MHLIDRISGPLGHFRMSVYRRGILVDVVDEPNLIVDLAKGHHAALLGAADTNRKVSKFGVGTNGTAPAAGNIALASAFIKNTDAVVYPAANQVAFAFSLASGEANGMAILEFGLFTTNGQLYARKTRASALNKESDISFSGTWTITF